MRMRRIVALSAGMMLGAGSLIAQAGGISIGAVITGQIIPGVYGRVVLGNRRPPLVYAHPVMVDPVPYGAPVPPPLYLYVSPFESHHWHRYCHQYRACQRPVYFVSSPEYARGFDLERWRREHPHWGRDRDRYRRAWRDSRYRDDDRGDRGDDGRYRRDDRRYRGDREEHDRGWRRDDHRDRARDRGRGPGDRWDHGRGHERDHRDRRDRRDD